MGNRFLIILILLLISGCSVIHEGDGGVITGKRIQHHEEWVQYVPSGDTIIPILHPAYDEYLITVECDGVKEVHSIARETFHSKSIGDTW